MSTTRTAGPKPYVARGVRKSYRTIYYVYEPNAISKPGAERERWGYVTHMRHALNTDGTPKTHRYYAMVEGSPYDSRLGEFRTKAQAVAALAYHHIITKGI